MMYKNRNVCEASQKEVSQFYYACCFAKDAIKVPSQRNKVRLTIKNTDVYRRYFDYLLNSSSKCKTISDLVTPKAAASSPYKSSSDFLPYRSSIAEKFV